MQHSFRVVSRTFDISKSSVHDIVHRVNNAIIWILRTVIAFPTSDDLGVVGGGFAQLAGSPAFSSAVGAIDGCHIRLKPPAATAQCYLNRKLFHSIQLPICLITPYREPVQNPLQARFNSKHPRAWNIVERAFGVIKTSWCSVFFKGSEPCLHA